MTSEWQPITTPPASPMRVLMYSALAQWRDFHTNAVIEIPPLEQSVRYDVGYWSGERFHHSGTNHEVFEDELPGHPDYPTHWMPLPEPPQ